MKDDKSEKVSFTLPQSIVKLLKELSQKTNLKMSTIVKLGIENFNDKNK